MWLRVALCGFVWRYVVPCGVVYIMWRFVVPCGVMWLRVALCGSVWHCVDYVAFCGVASCNSCSCGFRDVY